LTDHALRTIRRQSGRSFMRLNSSPSPTWLAALVPVALCRWEDDATGVRAATLGEHRHKLLALD
jgi:hypothetical protein